MTEVVIDWYRLFKMITFQLGNYDLALINLHDNSITIYYHIIVNFIKSTRF